MDPNVQAEIERQQSQLLEKMSTIFDNKIDSMKRQLEDVSNKAHESQMSELKRMRFAEPRSFKKKGHEQQYKHNEKVKTAVTEAKEATLAREQDACIAKLDEGIELIEGRQKLILMADRSDFGWKTVGEYLDNELAENDEDAKKMKKAEKEAQRKITEARASKMAKSRASFSRLPRPVSRSSSFPTQYASPGTSNHHTSATVGVMSASDFRGQVRRSGTCFSCGKVGHWRNECPLLAVAQTHEGKKLSIPNMSVNSTGVILQNDDTCNVISCQQGELGGESDDLSLNEGDFLENDPPQADQVRGRLRAHLHFWEEIGATEPVLSIIREGYKLPLLTIPQSVLLRNNKSAFDNCSFVSKAIADLLANQCVDVVDSQPWVVNPLSVSVRDDGKKRLVLDLRHVNPHLYKYKFKCEDIAVAQLLLGEGYYLYTFDIKSAYHHVDIFESHRTYLGFQWQHHGKPTFFVFNVLPFGLSTAPYTFTKLLKPVVSHWRGSGIRVCMFLDDGFGGNSSLESASADAHAVETCLCALGFTLSSSKCNWQPALVQTWLGYVFNMSENRLYVTQSRVTKLKESLSTILTNPDRVTAKGLAQVTGRIISMAEAIGSSVYLHTRHMYYAIESRTSWNSIILCSPKLMEELNFWDTNLDVLNGKKLFDQPQSFDAIVYSDASAQGYGGYVISDKDKLICQGQWASDEKAESSTWRELKAVHNMLLSVGSTLQGHKLQWHTDNQNITRIIHRGSMKTNLQEIVEDVVHLCTKYHIVITPVWVPRDENQLADYLSKLTDVDDWGIQPHIFQWVTTLWGPFTIDRFASWYNTKCNRFNSRFWNPGCEGIDAFSLNWQGENNWVVPPPSQIVRAWKHFQICQARGVLIIPLWKGAVFWPCVCPDGIHLAKCVTDWVALPEFNSPATVKGRTYNSMFYGQPLSFKLIAVYVNWQNFHERRSDRGFCLSGKGLCDYCLKS